MSLFKDGFLDERFVEAIEKIANALERQADTAEKAMNAAVPMIERTAQAMDELDDRRGRDRF